MGVINLKPKKKQVGIRNSNPNFINEKNIEQNLKNEIANEIKPKTSK